MEASRVTKIILSSLLQSYYVKPFSFFTFTRPDIHPLLIIKAPIAIHQPGRVEEALERLRSSTTGVKGHLRARTYVNQNTPALSPDS